MEPVTYPFSNTICKKCGWEDADLPSKGQESQAAEFFAAERAAKMGHFGRHLQGGNVAKCGRER